MTDHSHCQHWSHIEQERADADARHLFAGVATKANDPAGSTREPLVGLAERLRERAKCTDLGSIGYYGKNDSGMMRQAATALEEQSRRVEDQQEMIYYLAKWVERGLFDPNVTPKEALSVIAHYPTMPFKTGRWDVDHKPYAEAFYKAFPIARTALSPSDTGEDL